MYIMYFCDWPIGLSAVACGIIPRFWLCRTVRNVVTMLISTAITITTFASTGTCSVPANSTLSEMCAPKMDASGALRTIGSGRPYLVAWPGFHSAIARSTLNSANQTGSWATTGRQPINGLTGCLPVVAQLPVWFALFSVLRAIAEWKPGQATKYGLPEPMVRSAHEASIFGAHISDKVL